IYSVSTNTSVGKLFMAGIVPGILLAFLLMTVTWVVAKRNRYPTVKLDPSRKGGESTLSMLLGLGTCLVVNWLPPVIAYLVLGPGATIITAIIWLLFVYWQISSRKWTPAFLTWEAKEVWVS